MAKPKTRLRRVRATPAPNSTPAPPPDLGKAEPLLPGLRARSYIVFILTGDHAAQFNPGAKGNARFQPDCGRDGLEHPDALWRRDIRVRSDGDCIPRRAICRRA